MWQKPNLSKTLSQIPDIIILLTRETLENQTSAFSRLLTNELMICCPIDSLSLNYFKLHWPYFVSTDVIPIVHIRRRVLTDWRCHILLAYVNTSLLKRSLLNYNCFILYENESCATVNKVNCFSENFWCLLWYSRSPYSVDLVHMCNILQVRLGV